MKVRVKHVDTEAKYSYTVGSSKATVDGSEVTLDIEYSRDGRDWGHVCAMTRWVPGEQAVNGKEIAQAVQTELQARVDGADDKIAELRAIRQEGC